MKIAICFAGHLRCIEKTYVNIYEKIIQPNNADVFLHTWDTRGNDLNLYRDAPLYGVTTSVSEINLLNPVLYKIETYKDNMFDINKMLPRTKMAASKSTEEHMFKKANNMLAMFYGVQQSIKLKTQYEIDNDFTYDVVIRCRPDLLFDKKINIKYLIESNIIQYPLNMIYADTKKTYKEQLIHGMDDQFAFGSSKHMDIYGEMVRHLDDEFNFIHNKFWYAEQSLFAWLDFNNIKVVSFDVGHRIKRPMGYHKLDKEYGKYKD